MKQGFGHYIYKETGAKYTGYWKDSLKHGKGELIFPKQKRKDSGSKHNVNPLMLSSEEK